MTRLSVMACIPLTGELKTRGEGSPLHRDRYPFIPPLSQTRPSESDVTKNRVAIKGQFKISKKLKMHRMKRLTQTWLADLFSL